VIVGGQTRQRGVEAMMVGVTVAVAVVVVFFFGAGIAFGVAWIYAMSVRRERKPGVPGNKNSGYRDPEREGWPHRN
jgi:hypothetical protein